MLKYIFKSTCDGIGGTVKNTLDERAGMNSNLYIGSPEDIVAEIQPLSTIRLSVLILISGGDNLFKYVLL